MKIIHDYQGLAIRLTDERLAYILEHPEMIGLQKAIEETLAHPEHVVQSLSDDTARLYYRFYSRTHVSAKFICVVVKIRPDDAFLLTAYLTAKIKKGTILWPASR